jgi:aminopeptidase N
MQTKFINCALNADVKESLTHPIQVTVNHTIDAVNVFDEICYEKGACFIKTLKNYIGREALSEGVKEYFTRYSYKNTLTAEFIDTLQEVLHNRGDMRDLKAWTDSWINKAGANPIMPVVEKDYETLSVKLVQSLPNFGDKVFRE